MDESSLVAKGADGGDAREGLTEVRVDGRSANTVQALCLTIPRAEEVLDVKVQPADGDQARQQCGHDPRHHCKRAQEEQEEGHERAHRLTQGVVQRGGVLCEALDDASQRSGVEERQARVERRFEEREVQRVRRRQGRQSPRERSRPAHSCLTDPDACVAREVITLAEAIPVLLGPQREPHVGEDAEQALEERHEEEREEKRRCAHVLDVRDVRLGRDGALRAFLLGDGVFPLRLLGFLRGNDGGARAGDTRRHRRHIRHLRLPRDVRARPGRFNGRPVRGRRPGRALLLRRR